MSIFDDIFAGSQGLVNTMLTQLGVVSTLFSKTMELDESTGINNNTIKKYKLKTTTYLRYADSQSRKNSVEFGTSYCLSENKYPINKDDEIQIGTHRFIIVKVSPISSGDSIACYKLGLMSAEDGI